MKEQICFSSREAFRAWLGDHGKREEGLWVEFIKAAKGGLTAEEALEEALCFGWIDGQLKKLDDQRYLKYFSPRRKGSKWSEKNKKLAEKLEAAGWMTESGLNAIEQAKRDGEWDTPTYPVFGDAERERFVAAIAANTLASGNFSKMPPSVQKQFVGLYSECKKEETRLKRLEKLIGLLEQNKRPMG